MMVYGQRTDREHVPFFLTRCGRRSESEAEQTFELEWRYSGDGLLYYFRMLLSKRTNARNGELVDSRHR